MEWLHHTPSGQRRDMEWFHHSPSIRHPSDGLKAIGYAYGVADATLPVDSAEDARELESGVNHSIGVSHGL